MEAFGKLDREMNMAAVGQDCHVRESTLLFREEKCRRRSPKVNLMFIGPCIIVIVEE